MKFPFDEPKNVAVFTCKHILEDGADICYISHDKEDGFWQFLCGSNDHIESDARIISLKHAFDLDNSIGKLASMPLGCCAIRKKKGAVWQGFKK